MPTTPLGIRYPDSNGHTRTWEHWQALAGDVDALLVAKQPRGYTAGASSTYTLTAGVADVPGAVLPAVVTTRPNSLVLVIWSTDFQLAVAGAAVCYSLINIDGVDIAQNAIWNPSNVVAGARVTVASSFVYTIPAQGSHVIKMRATGQSNVRTNAIHTQVTAVVLS